MIGLIILIFLAFKIYRTAKENGRSAFGWTAAAIGVYIGVQFLIVYGILLVMSAGVHFLGWRTHSLNNFAFPITFLSEILGLVAVWIIANYVSDEPAGKNSLRTQQQGAPPQY
jgi:hypothetical protein